MDLVYPFTAVLGQDAAKIALLLNIVNPHIGGVLLSGEKGTAKSTLVRGVASLRAGVGVVDLPLNTTEDRLLGHIDFEYAVKRGEKAVDTGLLSRADGQILYVDEVNLLGDHLVKTLLDAAASGTVVVEREGVSCRYDARFILVGSMNPEEGPLRPQFLDRFGLYVEVRGEPELSKRMAIMRRRLEFEQNPVAFIEKWRLETERLALRLKRAQRLLEDVVIHDSEILLASVIAKDYGCAGQRAELVMTETARALAALALRRDVRREDIQTAAKYALPHRAGRVKPQETEQPAADTDQAAHTQRERGGKPELPSAEAEGVPEEIAAEEVPKESVSAPLDPETGEAALKTLAETLFNAEGVFQPSAWLMGARRIKVKKAAGRSILAVTTGGQGRYIRATFPSGNNIRDIALDATLRAAAMHPSGRGHGDLAVSITRADIRVKVRERKVGNTIIFVVDASGSMAANKQMAAVKGAVLSLLQDAYKKRERVALIAFRRRSTELLLGITKSVELAEKKLAELPTGGNTPIAAGLDMAYELVKAARVKDRDLQPVIVLMTDGKATFSLTGTDPFEDAVRAALRIGAENIRAVVIDTEQTFIKQKKAAVLAEAMNAPLCRLEELEAESIVTAIHSAL